MPRNCLVCTSSEREAIEKVIVASDEENASWTGEEETAIEAMRRLVVFQGSQCHRTTRRS